MSTENFEQIEFLLILVAAASMFAFSRNNPERERSSEALKASRVLGVAGCLGLMCNLFIGPTREVTVVAFISIGFAYVRQRESVLLARIEQIEKLIPARKSSNNAPT